MPHFTRRSFLTGVAAAGLETGSLVSRPVLDLARAVERRPLRIPELVDARHHTRSIALSVERGETAFFAGRASRTLGFNGSYLGPTLRLHRGDEVEMAVTNNLRQVTALHWHGLLVPTAVDGRPHQPVAPGAAWRPVLRIDQLAATLWYHAHTHGRTAEQVYAGLTGMLIVTDEAEQSLGLPSDYGIDGLPLVLQDRAFTRDGRLI